MKLNLYLVWNDIFIIFLLFIEPENNYYYILSH